MRTISVRPRRDAGGARAVHREGTTRRAVAAASVVAAAAFAAGAAYAHTVGTSGTTYDSNGLCVKGSAWIQHGTAVIDSAANVVSLGSYPYFPPCGPENYQAPYYIALRRLLYSWNGSSWAVCNDSGWVYNTTRAFMVYHQRRFGSAICGVRYYGTQATGYVYENVGGWKGGSVWSGYHRLPA